MGCAVPRAVASATTIGAGNPMHLDFMHAVRSGAVPFIKVELLRDNPARIPWVRQWRNLFDADTSFPVEWINRHLADGRRHDPPSPETEPADAAALRGNQPRSARGAVVPDRAPAGRAGGHNRAEHAEQFVRLTGVGRNRAGRRVEVAVQRLRNQQEFGDRLQQSIRRAIGGSISRAVHAILDILGLAAIARRDDPKRCGPGPRAR